MLTENASSTNFGVGLGVILKLFGVATYDGNIVGGYLFLMAGTAFFLWGCINYAQGKGYSGILGLLGLLSLIGLIALAVLPDRHQHNAPEKSDAGAWGLVRMGLAAVLVLGSLVALVVSLASQPAERRGSHRALGGRPDSKGGSARTCRAARGRTGTGTTASRDSSSRRRWARRCKRTGPLGHRRGSFDFASSPLGTGGPRRICHTRVRRLDRGSGCAAAALGQTPGRGIPRLFGLMRELKQRPNGESLVGALKDLAHDPDENIRQLGGFRLVRR